MSRDDRGTAVVEFALVMPLLLAAVLAVAEVAIAARLQLEVVHAAREGARQAATRPDPEHAVEAVRSALGERAAGARISVDRPARVGAAAVVGVVVPHRVAAPVFGGFTVEVRARAVMRVER